MVIAVDLNSDLLGRHLRTVQSEPADEEGNTALPDLLRRLQSGLETLLPARDADDPPSASLLTVLASSVNIMQVRITRSRTAGDPPEVLISPRLAHLSLFDFHRGREAMEEGRRAVASVLPDLRDRGLIAR